VNLRLNQGGRKGRAEVNPMTNTNDTATLLVGQSSRRWWSDSMVKRKGNMGGRFQSGSQEGESQICSGREDQWGETEGFSLSRERGRRGHRGSRIHGVRMIRGRKMISEGGWDQGVQWSRRIGEVRMIERNLMSQGPRRL
jgi:hypothetical protein